LSVHQILPETPANTPSELGSQRWFAAHTRSCQEKRVAQHLSARDIEFFLPVFRKEARWKNGLRVPIERPLLSGYVFVKVGRSERVRVLELPGVHSIVGAGREPTALPSQEIEALRMGIHSLNPEPHPYLSVGDRAKIQNGPLKGMTGIVLRKQNGSRLVLSLELSMRSVSVEVNQSDLEPVAPSPNGLLSGVDATRGGPMEIHPSLFENFSCEPC
jgi:transcriptional antiterminator NusG